MSLTSPEDIKNWYDGVQLYDAGKYTEAIATFRQVSLQNSRILFNIGCCYLTVDDVASASENYKGASENDRHLSIAFFMRGLASYLLKDYSDAMENFDKSLTLLRGNRYLDYKQLGLKYQLYACEIIANQGVVAYQQGDKEKAKSLLQHAVELKSEKKHEQIPEMITLVQAGYPLMPFNPPQNAIFRPPKSYVDNLIKKNYLGKAKVISTENTEDIYSCFSGIKEQIKNNLKTNDKPAPEKPKPLKKESTESIDEKSKSTSSDSDSVFSPVSLTPASERDPQQISKSNRPRSPAPPRSKLPPPPMVTNSTSGPDQDSLSPKNSPPQKLKSAAARPKPPCSPLPPRRKALVEEERRSSVGDVPSKKFSPPSSHPDFAKLKPASPLSQRRSPVLDEFDATHNARAEQRRFSSPPSQRGSTLPVDFAQLKPASPLPQRRSPVPDELHATHNARAEQRRFSSPPSQRGSTLPADFAQLQPASPLPQRRSPIPDELDAISHAIAEQRRFSQNAYGLLGQANSAPPIPDSDRAIKSKPSQKMKKEKSRKSSDESIEIAVQYSYIKKIKIPDGCSIDDIYDIVKNVKAPREIELCFNDDLGRQQRLSKKNFNDVLTRRSKPPKFYCFPGDQ